MCQIYSQLNVEIYRFMTGNYSQQPLSLKPTKFAILNTHFFSQFLSLVLDFQGEKNGYLLDQSSSDFPTDK